MPQSQSTIGYLAGILLGKALQDGDERHRQKQYSNAVNNVIRTMQEQKQYTDPARADQNIAGLVADKYAYQLDQQYPLNPKVKKTDERIAALNQIIDNKNKYDMYSNGGQGTQTHGAYLDKIAQDTNNIRQNAVNKGLFTQDEMDNTFGGNTHQDAIQATVDRLTKQRQDLGKEYADTQLAARRIVDSAKLGKAGATLPVPAYDPTTAWDEGQATLQERSNFLGGMNPVARQAFMQKMLVDKKYSPEVVNAAMSFYGNTVQQQNQSEAYKAKSEALAAFIREYTGTKDEAQKGNALSSYLATTGNIKELVDAYKAFNETNKGRYKDIAIDLANAVAASGFDTRTGTYVNPTLLPKGVNPTEMATARIGADSRITAAEINANSHLAGITLEGANKLKLEAGKQKSQKSDLNDIERDSVRRIHEAMTDGSLQPLLKTTEGRYMFGVYQKAYNKINRIVTADEVEKMIPYYRQNTGIRNEDILRERIKNELRAKDYTIR